MAYGRLGLKPSEFWELQPKDIMIMDEGFEDERKYKEALELQNLRLLRYIGYTTYLSIPTKKGVKKDKLINYYPLPLDSDYRREITTSEKVDFFEKKEAIITNGKLRGYRDKDGNVELIN